MTCYLYPAKDREAMRTPRELYSKKPIVYTCELVVCPQCSGPLETAYVSGAKTVQTMAGVLTIARRPKRCADPACAGHAMTWKAAHYVPVKLSLYDVFRPQLMTYVTQCRATYFLFVHHAHSCRLEKQMPI